MADRSYPSFFIFKDKQGEYRWRYHASNAQVIADSGEGYKSKSDCRHGIELMMGTNQQTPVWTDGDAE